MSSSRLLNICIWSAATLIDANRSKVTITVWGERDMSAARRSAIDSGGALRAVFAGVCIMQVIDTADTWGQFASRMKMATEGADEYNHAQDRMVQSAQTTFRAINETRKSFIQLSPVLREMGYFLDQSIDAMEAFSGLLAISGANAERGVNATLTRFGGLE